MAVTFAARMALMKASEIREILKITQRPEVISFAGGLPAPEVFPVEEMKQVAMQVLQEEGSLALQYSTTEGHDPLRRQIAGRMNSRFHTDVAAENILVTAGSQQALDFCGKLFLNEGDAVLCESPTYLAAITAFRAYQPRFISVPTDEDGMIDSELEKILATAPNVKFIYVIPDFQNPTGRTWPAARRRRLYELAVQYDIPVVEDNPYGELRFEGEPVPCVKSLDQKGLVIHVSTFSKTFCPGLRIGWITAAPSIFEKFVLIKQGADLHTSSISQRELSKYLEMYDYDANIAKITGVYRKRRDAMIEAMDTYLPDGVSHTNPQGGLFLWVELPPHIESVKLLKRCLKHNVAFVPGDSFFPDRTVTNTMRLNYSNMPEERIVEGIKRLAAAIKDYPRDR
jgi:2-aminoadipate transaminase